MEATKGESCLQYSEWGRESVQTLDDTRKQNASRAYRQQHKQIVPSATTDKVHTNITHPVYSQLDNFFSSVGV